MSQLGYICSGNKLQRQKKGPWSLGERKAKVTCLEKEKRGGKGTECSRESIMGIEGGKAWAYSRGAEHALDPLS